MVAKAIAMQRANGLARFVTGQMYYSLLARDIETEYVPMALDAGVGTMVWSPLSSGFLSGKYSRDDPDGQSGRLASMDVIPFDRERGYDIVETMTGIAQDHDVPVAAVALAWALDRPTVSTAIMGFTSEAQFSANVAAADLRLREADLARLDQVSAAPATYPANFLARFQSDARHKAVA